MSRMGIDLTQGWRGPITQLNQYEDQQQGQIAQAHELQMRLSAAQALRNTSGMNPQPEGQANQLQQAYAQGQQRRGRSMTSENQAGMGPSPMEKQIATAKIMQQQEPPEPQGGSISITGANGTQSEDIPADQNQPDAAAARTAWENGPKQVTSRLTQARQQQEAATKARKESGDEEQIRQQGMDAVQQLEALGVTDPQAILAGQFPDGMKDQDTKNAVTKFAKQYEDAGNQLQKRQRERTGGSGYNNTGGGQSQQQSQGGTSPKYSVGQMIRTPKGNVKVVGLDTDGHPLIEPVQ